MSEERDRLAEEFSKAYLDDIACADLSYSRSIDIEIGFEAGYDAGVESEKKKAEKLVEALEFYRDHRNWLKKEGAACSSIIADTGIRAKQALDAYKQESEGADA